MRLIYVKARIGGTASSLPQAHMVLAYYPTPDAEPLVLDNLMPEIRPASHAPDLQPVFSFNSEASGRVQQETAPRGRAAPAGCRAGRTCCNEPAMKVLIESCTSN